jgi:hypothetical protein
LQSIDDLSIEARLQRKQLAQQPAVSTANSGCGTSSVSETTIPIFGACLELTTGDEMRRVVSDVSPPPLTNIGPWSLLKKWELS